MPNDERTATALDRFIGELWRAWTMAGPPSYGEFETLSRRVCGPGGVSGLQAGVLYASTTQEILTGQRRRPPKWQWVARFVTVLRVTAAESGMDPNSLGTFAEWKAKHEAACADLAAAPRVAAAPVESGQVVTYESAAYAVPRQAAPPSLNKSSSGALDGELLTTVGRAFIAGWWHEFRDVVPDWFQDYLSLEPAASLIRTYDTTLIPGLLQTEAYASAVVRTAPHDFPATAVRRLVELRMRRQQILTQPRPPQLWAVLYEAVLRRPVGDVTTMRSQIRHLIAISERPNVKIQVIPLHTKIRTVVSGAITLLRFPGPDTYDVVYLEQLTGALYLYDPADILYYRKVLGGVGVEALEPAATISFLREILGET